MVAALYAIRRYHSHIDRNGSAPDCTGSMMSAATGFLVAHSRMVASTSAMARSSASMFSFSCAENGYLTAGQWQAGQSKAGTSTCASGHSARLPLGTPSTHLVDRLAAGQAERAEEATVEPAAERDDTAPR
jgi:hypothetical protein